MLVTEIVYKKTIIYIRLDLYYGLRRKVARIAMPFGQVPEGFLFLLYNTM